jgi:hypothetical protein
MPHVSTGPGEMILVAQYLDPYLPEDENRDSYWSSRPE